MNKKKIYTSCPFSNLREKPVMWEDVYIKYQAKPGRKWYYMGPMLSCRGDLERDESGNFDEDLDTELLLKILKTEGIVVMPSSFPNCPNVFIDKDSFTWRDTEDMLRVLLKTRGIHNPKFVWNK